ncbi:hypothetical protein BH23GEM9_BH23GEM9_32830 [soil metagenome]
MRRRFTPGVVILLAVLGSGCYRATVDTGLTPSGQSVERPWAHSFIAGLVPPSTVETASHCPNGVARVETQLSFLNMLANAVTLGLYSPMTITVQCAAARDDSSSPELNVPQDAPVAEAVQVFNRAVQDAHSSGEPVFVRFQ